MADISDYWFAAKEAIKERSFAEFGKTLKALENVDMAPIIARHDVLIERAAEKWNAGAQSQPGDMSIGRPRAQFSEHQEVAAMMRQEYINPRPTGLGAEVDQQLHAQHIDAAKYRLSEAREIREGSVATDPFTKLATVEAKAIMSAQSTFFPQQQATSQAMRDAAWSVADSSTSQERREEVVVAQMTMRV